MTSFLWDEPLSDAGSNKVSKITDAIYTATRSAQDATTDNQGPISIAIFGPWGSGKTSILKCLQKEFSNGKPEGDDDNVKALTVWFEPWRYENEENLIVPLLTELISTISRDMERHGTNSKRALEDAKKAAIKTGMKLLGRVAKASARTAAGFLANQVGAKSDDIAQLGKDFLSYYEGESERYEYPKSESEAFKDDFTKLINEAAKVKSGAKAKRVRPVCIFIDDLDRCSSKQVQRLLESMKNFLWVDGVTYILALDKEQVTMALAAPHLEVFASLNERALVAAKERALNYMEKFFLYSYDLSNGSDYYEKQVVSVARDAFFDDLIKLHPDLSNHFEWQPFRSLLENCTLNLRKIKRVLRWLHYELHMTPHGDNLDAQFAELIFSENYPVIWLEDFVDYSVPVRVTKYTRIKTTLSLLKLISHPDDVIGEDTNTLWLAIIEILQYPTEYKQRLNDYYIQDSQLITDDKTDEEIDMKRTEMGDSAGLPAGMTASTVESTLLLAGSDVGNTLSNLMLGNDTEELTRLYNLVSEAQHLRR